MPTLTAKEPPAELPRVQARNLPEQIADAIVEGIASGALALGQRLIEVELAQQMAVSRVPLREALKTLEAQGILERAPHRGVRVVELSKVRVDNICEVRIALEVLAASRASKVLRNEPKFVQRLNDIVSEMEMAASREDWAWVNKCDLDFHREICLSSGNEFMFTLWQGIARHVLMINGREILSERARSQIVREHRRLLAELLKNEQLNLQRLMEKHIMPWRS